jgi:fructose-1,6-bisphosphatase
MEDRLPLWRVAVNILNKDSQTVENGGPLAWGLDEVLTIPHGGEHFVTNIHTEILEPGMILRYDPKQLKRETRFDT